MERLAFTIKDNRRETTDYVSLFDTWENKGCKIECKFLEYDSQGRPHYHGIVEIPKKVYKKTLNPKGFHFNYKPITDEKGWLKYCKKDQTKRSEQGPCETRERALPIKIIKTEFIYRDVN